MKVLAELSQPSVVTNSVDDSPESAPNERDPVLKPRYMIPSR
jgi:hypothetical protein